MIKALPKDLQSAILKAGKEAAQWARDIEVFEDQGLFQELISKKVITVHNFPERDNLFELMAPVKEQYAKELGVEAVLKAVNKLSKIEK